MSTPVAPADGYTNVGAGGLPATALYVTVQVNVLLSDRVPSDAVAVTWCVPASSGVNVPLMTPVAWLMLALGGSPAALYVSTSLSGSVALRPSITGLWVPSAVRSA